MDNTQELVCYVRKEAKKFFSDELECIVGYDNTFNVIRVSLMYKKRDGDVLVYHTMLSDMYVAEYHGDLEYTFDNMVRALGHAVFKK